METENDTEKNVDKNWFRKHSETLTVIAALFGGFIWMDSKFDKVNERLSSLEKDVSFIKIFLSIKGIICK